MLELRSSYNVTRNEADLVHLPDDSESLKAMVRSLLGSAMRRSNVPRSAAACNDLQLKSAPAAGVGAVQEVVLRASCGSAAIVRRSGAVAARLRRGDGSQAGSSGRSSTRTEAEEELRRVKRRKGRRNLANFENLPVTTHVHELSAAATGLPLLRHRAQGDRRGRELADRISSRPLRTHPACAQEVCLPGLREQRQ